MNHTLIAGTIQGHPMQNKFSNPTRTFLVHKYPHHPSYGILRFKPILISRMKKESTDIYEILQDVLIFVFM